MHKKLSLLLLTCLAVSACNDCGRKKHGQDAGPDAGDAGPEDCKAKGTCPVWEGNYRYVWPTSDTTALAAVPLSTDSTGVLGEISLLTIEDGKTKSQPLNNKAVMGSVQVNLNGTPGATFIGDASASDNTGKVYYVNLSANPVTAQPLAIEGLFTGPNVAFGATGKQVLVHVAPTVGLPPSSKLYWANGTDAPKQLTSTAARYVFSPDRTKAVIADAVSSGKGNLIVVDMATGNTSAPHTPNPFVTGGTLLDNHNQPLFTVAGDMVAFLDNSGNLQTQKISDSTATRTIESTAGSKLAGLSPDGTKIAYFVGSTVKFGSSDGSDTPVQIGTVTQSGVAQVPPVVSPDKSAVLYFSALVNKAGVLGKAFITSTTANATPFALGDNSAVTQYLMGSCPFNVALVTRLSDPFNQLQPSWTGLGTITRTTPGSNCSLSGMSKADLIPGPTAMGTTNGAHATDFVAFNGHEYVAFLGGFKSVGDMQFGDAYVAPMGSGNATKVGEGALVGSLEASRSTSRILYIGSASISGDNVASGELVIGWTDGSKSSLIGGGVHDAHFTPDGHVFAVVLQDGQLGVQRVSVP